MYIIATANEKGGVAKTTTAVSLGVALAETHKKTLLVDLDPQANLSLALGINPHKLQRSIVNVLLENASLPGVIVKTDVPGVDLIPCKEDMTLSERYVPTRPQFEFILKRAIENANLDYEYVIFDCAPFLGVVTLNALATSNLLLIPTQAEFFSIYALRNLMDMVRRVRLQNNPQLTYRILLTMYDSRNRTHRLLNDQLRTTFQSGVLNTIINIDTKLRESQVAGVSILNHAPHSRSATEYRTLAQEIIEYAQEKTPQTS